MKTKIGILVLAVCTTFLSVQAQRTVTTARATSYDISDNLDLDAVASIFGDSENLEQFERTLNDPDNRISNLDLNEDGYIDYLRVLENSSDRNSLVVIQAVLDKDVFQDVATIEIERVHNGNPRIQIVGDSYIYGSNYIIEPVYVRSPLIFSFFWSPRYVTYHSPYYWGYYPNWYSYYRPYPTFRYHRHVHSHINRYNTYNRTNDRRFHISGDNYNKIRRSDYATRYPNRTFSSRNEGLKNKQQLNERRPSASNRQGNRTIQGSNNRQYQGNKSVQGRNERQRGVIQNNRAGSDIQSGSNQSRTRENRTIENSRQRPESSNGPVKMKSANRNEGSSVSRNRSNSTSGSNRQIQSTPRSSDSRNQSISKPTQERSSNQSSGSNRQMQSTSRSSDSRNQSISKPTQERSSNRVGSSQRSSAPREKSGSVNSRSNTEVKQATPRGTRSEPSKGNETRESGNGRRR